jgi:hypothetical protein
MYIILHFYGAINILMDFTASVAVLESDLSGRIRIRNQIKTRIRIQLLPCKKIIDYNPSETYAGRQ